MPDIQREKIFAVGKNELLATILDFEAYPDFLPEVVSASRVAGGTMDARVRFELEVVKRFQYTLDFECVDSEVRWTLVESDLFKRNEGMWRLESISSAQTRVWYELTVEFGFFVPGMLTRKLTELNLPRMFEAFEGRAQVKGIVK